MGARTLLSTTYGLASAMFAGGGYVAAETVVTGSSLVPVAVMVAGIAISIGLAWRTGRIFQSIQDRLNQLEKKIDPERHKRN